MARNSTLQVIRATRAALDAQAANNNLIVGEPYLITDEGRFAIGLSASSYQAMATQAEAGGTQAEPDEYYIRWNINDTATTFKPSGTPGAFLYTDTFQAYGNLSLIDVANGHLVLNKGAFLGSVDVIALHFATSNDSTLTQAPGMVRYAFKGVLPATASGIPLLIDMTDNNVGQMTLGVAASMDALTVDVARNSYDQTITSDTIDLGLGANHLYEVKWTNDTAGAGGTVTFEMDGTQIGATYPTTGKALFSTTMDMEVNSTYGNTANGVDGLEVEYVELGWSY
jgi:hypothetical protein